MLTLGGRKAFGSSERGVLVAKEFKGEINLDMRDSKPDWDAFRADKAPEGAPNVLVVLYDDTGLRRLVAVRRPDQDADAAAARGQRADVLAVAHDGALLADALDAS